MNNFNILILEDEPLNSLNTKRLLEKNYFNVIGIAQNSEKAIYYIQSSDINIILVDIAVKDFLIGIETIKLIQESFDIPAIIITSHKEDAFLKQVSQINFTAFIMKPFSEETLLREIKLAFYKSSCNKKPKYLINLTHGYTYNLKKQILEKDEMQIDLSNKEKFFLHILVANKNELVINKQIDMLVWNDKVVDNVSRRHLLYRLRKKIPELKIETIKGEGYKLVI